MPLDREARVECRWREVVAQKCSGIQFLPWEFCCNLLTQKQPSKKQPSKKQLNLPKIRKITEFFDLPNLGKITYFSGFAESQQSKYWIFSLAQSQRNDYYIFRLAQSRKLSIKFFDLPKVSKMTMICKQAIQEAAICLFKT